MADVIALFGPTGVGKTEVAISLAERLRERGEDPIAISADAIQVYRGLEILSGVASPGDQSELEHRLVSFVPIGETFSAGRFAALAHAEIDGALKSGRRPLVVGGTGLYLRSALTALDFPPKVPPLVRDRLTREAESIGVERLHERLSQAAPEIAARIDRRDRSRVLRALELRAIGALPRSRDAGGELWTTSTRVPTRLFGLVRDRDELHSRIDARVDRMVASGAAAEVRRADLAGASDTARAAIGFADLRDGDIEAMKRRTRRYAKRQLTWMRKLGGISLVDITSVAPAATAAEILAALDADPSSARRAARRA